MEDRARLRGWGPSLPHPTLLPHLRRAAALPLLTGCPQMLRPAPHAVSWLIPRPPLREQRPCQGAYRALCEKLAVLHHREFGKFRRLKGRH